MATGPRRDLFGDIAVSKNLLTWAQVRDALKRQSEYKQKGIPLRIGECCLELNLLTQVQINEVLATQREKRKSIPVEKKIDADFDFSDIEDGETFKLGRYKLDKRLGGAMGIVFRGIDEQTGSTIALKVLPRNLAHDPNFVERFKREVKATCVLSHPNIVHIYDTGIEQGVFYLATEFIDGETLTSKLRRETRFSDLDSLVVLRDVAKALGHAHSRRVLHRDLKPDNVMITKEGVVKLADFGLAKFLRDEQPITAEGIAVGTPHYISPEQARALKETDHRSDLYSLGATVFHLITGRLPYEGDNGAEVMKRHVFEAVPDPRSVRPDLNPAIADMLMKLMAKSPNQRYQTADELVAAVEPLIQGLEGGGQKKPAARKGFE
ncbi:MAG TPA: serine/threonine-protein kinase [Planctomycetota bacterium]|nr:serine/threonine-protein kinase [Planctomycetota bacterium]